MLCQQAGCSEKEDRVKSTDIGLTLSHEGQQVKGIWSTKGLQVRKTWSLEYGVDTIYIF